MGLYIEDSQKDVWIAQNGQEITKEEALKYDVDQLRVLENKCIVCLVDNFNFHALAVGYSNQERDYFGEEDDKRDKKWYLLDITKVGTYSRVGAIS